MPSKELLKEEIVVSYVGKWGPKVGEVFYGINEPLTADMFEKGKAYTVLVDTAKSGKKYIKQIIGASSASPLAALAVAASAPAAANKPATAYTPRDYNAEARGKVTSAAYSAALASPVLGTFAEDTVSYLKLIDEVVAHVSKRVWEAQEGK